MIQFSCPKCQKVLKAPDEKAGVAVRCPQCKQQLTVPSPTSVSGKPETPAILPPPPSPAEEQWYFTRNGQQQGAVTTEQLNQLAASGQLLPTDMVWKHGMQKWSQASTINGLFPAATPPPLPPTNPTFGSSTARPTYPWPEQERSSVNMKLRWTKIGMIASIVVGFLFLISIVGAIFCLPFFSLAYLIYEFGIKQGRLHGRWVPVDGQDWVEFLSGGIYKQKDGKVGTFALHQNQKFIDIFVSGQLFDSWKILSWGSGTLEIQDIKGEVHSFKKGKTLEEKQVSIAAIFSTSREDMLASTWQPADGAGHWIQFTKDGAFVSGDQTAGRYTLSGEEPNEVIKVQLTDTSSRQFRIVSLSTEQLVLAEGQEAKIYRRHTPEKQAEPSAVSGSSASKSESAALEPVSESEGESADSPANAGGSGGMQSHIQFICPHCFVGYHGSVSVGEQTRCDNCGKCFRIVPHAGNQDSYWRMFNVVGGLVSLFAGEKCPMCKKRKVRYLGKNFIRQRYYEGLGQWKSEYAAYYQCDSCNRTFYLEQVI